jgi:hypothetical protein
MEVFDYTQVIEQPADWDDGIIYHPIRLGFLMLPVGLFDSEANGAARYIKHAFVDNSCQYSQHFPIFAQPG